MPVTTSIKRSTSETKALQLWMWNHRLTGTRLCRSLVLRMRPPPDALDTEALPRHALRREPRARRCGARPERHAHYGRWSGQVIPLLADSDPVETLARGQVQQIGVGVTAEAHIGGQLLAGGDVRQFLASRAQHLDARPPFAPRRQPDVAVGVCDHAVWPAAGLVLPGIVDEYASVAGLAVRRQVIGLQLMRALQGLLAFLQGLEIEPAVVVPDHVQGFLVGGDEDAVALAAVGHHAVHRAVGVETVHRETVLFDRLVPQVAGITEVDASLLVDTDVVECVIGPSVEQTSQDIALARLHISLHQHASTVVGAQGRNHVALAVELEAVSHPARAAEDGRLPGLGIVLPDIPGLEVLPGGILTKLGKGDVTEIDHPVVTRRYPFGQHAAAVEEAFELGARRNKGGIARRRGESGIVREGGYSERQSEAQGSQNRLGTVPFVHRSSCNN